MNDTESIIEPRIYPSVYIKSMGGLGNQLFQYWTAFAVARRNACSVVVDTSVGPWSQRLKAPFKAKRPFLMDSFQGTEFTKQRLCWVGPWVFPGLARPLNVYKESAFPYDAGVESLRSPVYLSGYWQNPRYFDDFKSLILKLMVPRVIPDNLDNWIRMARQSSAASVHVRRGNYVWNLGTRITYPPCSLDYYNRAMSLLKRRVKTKTFFVFTDDVRWCKKKFKNRKDVQIVSGSLDNDAHELYLMSKCRHNIIANSTYSWWAAWINKNKDKKIVAPKRWFRRSKTPTRHFLPKEWIKI